MKWGNLTVEIPKEVNINKHYIGISVIMRRKEKFRFIIV